MTNIEKDAIFNQVQEIIKQLLIKPPYNLTPEDAEHWNESMIFQSQKRAKLIIDEMTEKNTKPEEIAKIMLDKFWNRAYFNTKEKIPNLNNDAQPSPNPISNDRDSNTLESAEAEDVKMEEDSGINAFKIFLDIVNKQEQFFMKRNYLNLGEYYYLFYTDPIKYNSKVMDQLETKRSLKKGFQTLQAIHKKKLDFFLGIKEIEGVPMLEYGFMDDDTFLAYKIGKFNINNKYIINKLSRYQNMSYIRDKMKECNVKNMKILHQIKKDIQTLWPETEAEIKILDEFRIRKSYNKNILKSEDCEEIKLEHFINDFKMKFKWAKNISSWVILSDEKCHFYFRILEK